MTSSAAPAPRSGPTTGAATDTVLRVVNEFYEANPFPGFDAGKYETRADLVTRASWYAARLDAEIPFDASVVDVGCGTGQLACFLALKDRRVLGIDYSQRSLELAEALKERLALKHVEFRRLDLLNWDLPADAFDYVFCNGVLHHTSDPYRGFQNLVRITKPGGRMVVGLYNRYGRLLLHIRRRFVRLVQSIDPKVKDRAIRKQLVELDADDAKRLTWFADQYEHPHESTHTVAEVLEWFRVNGIEYVSSFPHIELFGGQPKRIFRPRQLARWRAGAVAHLAMQLAWIVTQNAGGGYFVMTGRKRP